MTANDTMAAGFTGLLDLAAAAMGGRVLARSDEFFAEADNLLQPDRGVFEPGLYTDRGKWMDGWESARTRRGAALPDRDECVIALGVPGRVRALDIDTNHFLGNHPPFASVEAVRMPDVRDPDSDAAVELAAWPWTTILPQAPLRPGSQNLFVVTDPGPWTHARLTIYPDGGVARFRVYGEADPALAAAPALDDETRAALRGAGVELDGPAGYVGFDAAAARSGGLALACSDMFFGAMNNLIAPGRSTDMSGGWETRRRRGPGHDWIIVRLADTGADEPTLDVIELDTNHFKGNYPDDAWIEGIRAPGARPTDLLAADAPWQAVLPRVPLGPHARHFFSELAARGPFTHLRLSIHPCGGVSRLRAWGR